MKKATILLTPFLSSLITGGLAWFLSGAMALKEVVINYLASTAAGALMGFLLVLPSIRAINREIISLKSKALIQESQYRQEDRLHQPQPMYSIRDVQNIQELRDFVSTLTQMLSAAKEVENVRNKELEEILRRISLEISEAESLSKSTTEKLTELKKLLSSKEGVESYEDNSGNRY